MPGVTARHIGRTSADPHGQDRTLVAGKAGLGESSRPVESRLTYLKTTSFEQLSHDFVQIEAGRLLTWGIFLCRMRQLTNER